MNMAGESDSRVYVIEDDDDLRAAMCRTLQSAGYEAKGFASPQEFLSAVDLAAAACAIIDLRLPEMDGLELQRQIIALTDTLPIVIVSAFIDVPSTVTAMRRGAIDVLKKPYDSDQLLDAVAAALARGAALRQLTSEENLIASRIASLTPREKQVLALIFKGNLTKHIASELTISPKTVEVHRSRIRTKLGLESSEQLARMMVVYFRGKDRIDSATSSND